MFASKTNLGIQTKGEDPDQSAPLDMQSEQDPSCLLQGRFLCCSFQRYGPVIFGLLAG